MNHKTAPLGIPRDSVVIRNALSPATAARWGNKVRNGVSLVPLHSGARKGGGKLAPYFDFFVDLIEQDPDITLEELKSSLLMAHEVTCSTSGIDALLRRRGYTYKKRVDSAGTKQARCA